MKLSRQDWQKLRYPAIGFGLALILMTLLYTYVESVRDQAQQTLDKQTSQLNQARQKFQTSGQEKDTIVKYLPLYQQLISDGFIGEEHRIEWIDDLRTIHDQNKLFKINYSIASQEDYKPTFNLNAGTFKPKRSVMKLELAMLHEGDLLGLIEQLDARQTTPFILRDCEIVRLSRTISNSYIPNMQANCELDWITLREPEQPHG
jgi:hypothetical protein